MSLPVSHLAPMTTAKSQPAEATAVLNRLGLTGQVDDHPALFVSLSHAGLGSLELSSHLLHLPKEQAGQTLKHGCVLSSTDEPGAFVVPREIKAVAAFLNFNHFLLLFFLELKPFAGSWMELDGF